MTLLFSQEQHLRDTTKESGRVVRPKPLIFLDQYGEHHGSRVDREARLTPVAQS